MLLLILKSSACLAFFMLFYKVCLEKQSAHIFKRYYLLGAILVSIMIPFITFTQYIEATPIAEPVFFQPTEFTENIISETTSWQAYIPIVLWIGYAIGLILFGLRFVANLNTILLKIKVNPKFKHLSFINVLLEDVIPPHTFFNYIFLNKKSYEYNLIPEEVLIHEQTHAKQKHALDILIIEVLQIIFWFNPLIYLIKKDIKLNHEFLADQAVIDTGIDPILYKETLLAFSSNATEHQLANAINYSSIKKRFTVMKTQTSKTALGLRTLIILPLLAILIYSFSSKETVERTETSLQPITLQQTKTDKGATEAMMKEYRTFIKEVEETNMILAPKLNRAIAIYNIMTSAQRATVKKYPETPPINLSKVKSRTPTNAEFESWKNKDQFAIWIDGKFVDNSKLDDYLATDFEYYTNSFVYHNARSKKHPQPYQNHLYTKKGFEESYLKRNVKNYYALKHKYNNALKSNNLDNSELRILKAQLDNSYNLLSKEELKKYNITPLKKDFENTHKTSKAHINKKNILILLNKEGQLFLNNELCKIDDLKTSLVNITKTLNSREKENLIAFLQIENHNAPKAISQVENVVRVLESLKIKVKNDTAVNFGISYPPIQQKESLILILINKKGQLLVNDHFIEIKKLKTHLKILLKEEKNKPVAKIRTDSETPKERVTEVKHILRALGVLKISIERNGQQEATSTQITEYNKLAKSISSQPEGQQIIKLKDLNRLKHLHNLMSAEQKMNAEPFPKIAPAPVPEPAPKPVKIEVKQVAPPVPPKKSKKYRNRLNKIL